MEGEEIETKQRDIKMNLLLSGPFNFSCEASHEMHKSRRVYGIVNLSSICF